MYDNIIYLIISNVEIPFVNFEEILIDSYSTLRFSVNGTKVLLKWNNSSTPSFYDRLNTKEGPYTYSEIYEIVSTPEWLIPDNTIYETFIG
jgi:hypothetical protein